MVGLGHLIAPGEPAARGARTSNKRRRLVFRDRPLLILMFRLLIKVLGQHQTLVFPPNQQATHSAYQAVIPTLTTMQYTLSPV